VTPITARGRSIDHNQRGGKVDGKQGSFVTFAPTDCTKLQVTVSSNPQFPNWT